MNPLVIRKSIILRFGLGKPNYNSCSEGLIYKTKLSEGDLRIEKKWNETKDKWLKVLPVPLALGNDSYNFDH